MRVFQRGVIILSSLEKARLAVKASLDKKASEPLILEVRNLTIVADYFVICSGESRPQVAAIAEHVEGILKKSGVRPASVEGRGHNLWILLDYGDVIVHVFERETREYYELDKLWLDAPRIDLE
ncbi:MAG: ribosome silencing factor [Thermodesulfovibrionales bacterium]